MFAGIIWNLIETALPIFLMSACTLALGWNIWGSRAKLLQLKNQELDEEISGEKRKYATLSTEHALQKEEFIGQKNELGKVQSQLTNSREKLDHFSLKNTELESKVNTVIGANRDLTLKVEGLNRDNLDLQTRLDDASSKLIVAESDLTQARGDLESAQANFNQLETRLRAESTQSRDQGVTLRQKLNALRSEYDGLSTHASGLEEQSKSQQNAYAELLKKANAFEQENATLTDVIEGLKNTLKSKENTFEQNLMQERERFDRERSQYSLDLASWTRRLESAQNEVHELRDIEASSKYNVQKARGELATALGNLNGLEGQVAQLEDELERTKEQHRIGEQREGSSQKSFEAEIEALHQTLKNSRDERQEVHQENAALMAEIKLLKSQLAVQSDNTNTKSQRNMTDALAKLKSERDGLSKDKRELHASLASQNQELNSLRGTLSNLRKDYESFASKNMDLSKENLALQHDKQRLLDSLSELRAKGLKEQQGLKSLDDELDRLGDENNTLTKELLKQADLREDLEREVRALKKHIEVLEERNTPQTTKVVADFGQRANQSTRVLPKRSYVKKVTSTDKDDLKLIFGIGPVLEKQLNELGVFNFEQIASWTQEDIELVAEDLKGFPDRIVRDDWKGGAAKLLADKLAGRPLVSQAKYTRESGTIPSA